MWWLLSAADNLCKQFGPRSGQTFCRAWSGSKLFDTDDTDDIPERLFWKKKIILKIHRWQKSMQNYPACKVWLTVLGFNDTSILVGHFVSSPWEREKRDRRDSRGDEKRGTGKKEEQEWKWRNRRNKNSLPLSLPATRRAGLPQLLANISWMPRWCKLHDTFATPDHPQHAKSSGDSGHFKIGASSWSVFILSLIPYLPKLFWHLILKFEKVYLTIWWCI